MKNHLYKSTFLVSGADDSREEVEYPDNFSKISSFEKKVQRIDTKYVKATFEGYLFDGVKIELAKVDLKKELKIEVKHNFPFFKMHFEIEGNSSYIPNNDKSLPVAISNGHHQLFFFPSVDGVLSFPAFTKRNTLEINLSLNFIHEVFKDNWSVLEKIGEAIGAHKPFVFGHEGRKINEEIYVAIQQIVHCEIDDDYKKAYLKAKVIELLVLQLQDFKNDSKDYSLIPHHDKIMEAKKYIYDYINKPLTIPLIAKHIGMNTQHLKKEFKIKFGTTIFKFITNRRMELAFEMLKFTNTPISEIANNVGYKYSQHFSKVFKNKYGVNPGFYRKNNVV